MLEAVPAWKVIRLPAYGWQWTGRPLRGLAFGRLSPGKTRAVPYHQALSLAQEHGWGDGGAGLITGRKTPSGLDRDGQDHGRQSLLVNKYNLAGSRIRHGLEDPAYGKKSGPII